jgi:tryptophan-rich sensory protein
MKINNFFKLVISLVVTQMAGIVGSLFTMSSIPTWYATLIRPPLNPPNWIFGPVWTILYLMMGVALYIVWKEGDKKLKIRLAIYIFGFQLLANALWSIIFFGAQNVGLALVDIIILWFAIVATIFRFYKISKTAAYLLVPYLLWVTFATYLNAGIFYLN